MYGSFVISVLLFLTTASGQVFDQLYQTLLPKMDPGVIPLKDLSKPLIVKQRLSLIQIHEVNAKWQYLKTDMMITTQWTDTRLQWDPYDYNDVRMIHVPTNKIWKPDIILYNSPSGLHKTETKAQVRFDGEVAVVSPATVRSACLVDPSDRNDVITCGFTFGSWVYHGDILDLQFIDEGNVDFVYYFPHPKWEILNATGVRNVKYYSCCPEPYPDLRYTLSLRRKWYM